MDFAAVMVIGHFVVSVFNVPLGTPMYQFVPFPNMEICQEHVQYQVTQPQGYQLSIEYKMYKTAQCVTREEFQERMEEAQRSTTPPPVEETIPQQGTLPKGWEIE